MVQTFLQKFHISVLTFGLGLGLYSFVRGGGADKNKVLGFRVQLGFRVKVSFKILQF